MAENKSSIHAAENLKPLHRGFSGLMESAKKSDNDGSHLQCEDATCQKRCGKAYEAFESDDENHHWHQCSCDKLCQVFQEFHEEKKKVR